jgi:hypothetical protein
VEHQVFRSRVLIGMIIVGSIFLLTAGAAFAAASTAVSSSWLDEANGGADELSSAYVTSGISDTEEVTGTVQITGGEMIAGCIAAFFEVPMTDVVALRGDGYGFGEVAAAYFLAQDSGLTVAQILELREAGMGWGEIAKYLGLPPSRRDGNLGQIISGHLPVSSTVSAAAQRLAERLGTTPEEVAALLDQGAGYGTVVVAYKLAGEFEGVTPAELVEQRLAGAGWGQIKRELREAVATTSESQEGSASHGGPPDQAGGREDKGPPENAGPKDHSGAPDHAGPKDHSGPPDHAGPKDHNKKPK